MVMSSAAAENLVKLYLPEWWANYRKVDVTDRWYRGKLKTTDKPRLPDRHTKEIKELRDRAIGRWLGLVVSATAQVLYVEGYRPADSSENSPLWDIWQANQMDARQSAIHRGALAHGLSYVTVLPAERNGEASVKLRGKSARRMCTFWDEPADDEYPLYAIEGEVSGSRSNQLTRVKLYDDEAVYTLDVKDGKPEFLSFDEHRVGVCPVVRYGLMDLDGRADGVVEPNIDMAARIDQTVFDRLVVQRFGAFVVKYITGMDQTAIPIEGETEEEAQKRALLRLAISDFLAVDDPDAKVGSLPPTPLDGYIRSGEADIKQLASVTQTPPHALLGDMINLSAEGLAAAEMLHSRQAQEWKHSLGESHESAMRLSAHILGDADAAADDSAQVDWADLESRSLAQVADALGKLATMLGVPPQALWSRIPGVTQTDVESWKQLASDDDEVGTLLRDLAEQSQSTVEGASPSEAADLKAKFDALGVAIRAGVDPADAATRLGLDGIRFTGAVPTSLRLPEDDAAELEQV